MRIFILNPNSCSDGSGLGQSYEHSLASIGIEVKSDSYFNREPSDSLVDRINGKYRYHDRIGYWWRRHREEELVSIISSYNPDIVLIFTCEKISPTFIVKLKETTTAIIANYFTDLPSFKFRGDYRKFDVLRLYDIIFLASKVTIPVFHQIGCKRIEYLPFGFDDRIHYPVALEAEDIELYSCEISYIGTYGPLQEYWITHLLDYDIKIFGNGWEKAEIGVKDRWVEGKGIGSQMNKAISGSNLVFNMVRAEHCPTVSMKTFEIPACRGAMISNYTPDQDSFFPNKHSALYYTSIDNMVEQVGYFLKNKGRLEDIRGSAFLESKNHSYMNRAEELMKLFCNIGNNQ